MSDARRSADARRTGRATVRMVDRHASTGRHHGGGGGADRSRPRNEPEMTMRITTFEEFKELAQRGTFVPVCKEIVADLLTPVSAFLKIAEHSDYAFLLESVEGGEHVGRYSFLGKDPFLILRSRAGKTIIDRAG